MMQLYTLRNSEGLYYGGGVPGTSCWWVSEKVELAWEYTDTLSMILWLSARGSYGWTVEKVGVPCTDLQGRYVTSGTGQTADLSQEGWWQQV